MDGDRIEIVTRDDRNDQEVLITMHRVGIISPNEAVYIQVLNVIMKKALDALQLKLVGRDYFDAAATVNIFNANFCPFSLDTNSKYFAIF